VTVNNDIRGEVSASVVGPLTAVCAQNQIVDISIYVHACSNC